MLTVDAAAQVEKDLTKAGINIIVETPRKDDSFEIAVEDGGQIRLYPASVDLKVFPDKGHHQSIMWADEKGHENVRDVKVRRIPDRRDMTKAKWKEAFEKGRNFGLAMPEGTVYTVLEGPAYVTEIVQNTFSDHKDHYVTAKVKAVVPDNHWTFLLGTDESSQFISALPKRVRTVPAAHKALRPKGISENTTRQGEWFFVPASAAERKAIEALVADDPTRIHAVWLGASADKSYHSTREWGGDDQHDNYHDSDDDTSHVGLNTIFYNETLFATGYVIDDRRPEDRAPRHDPLWLYDWHRVVRNLEIQVPGMDQDGFD